MRINGHEGGVITGQAAIIWRRRDGGVPAVVFEGDDSSYGTSLTRIVVKSGGQVVKEVAGIEEDSWTFDDEQALNGGDWFEELAFEVYSQKPGFVDSQPVLIVLTRP